MISLLSLIYIIYARLDLSFFKVLLSLEILILMDSLINKNNNIRYCCIIMDSKWTVAEFLKEEFGKLLIKKIS